MACRPHPSSPPPERLQYLGANWYATYFGEKGLFGNRDNFVVYLRSTKSTDLVTLASVGAMFHSFSWAAGRSRALADQLREVDALDAHFGFTPKGSDILGGGGGIGGDFVVNLAAGQVSLFLSPQAAGSVGFGVEFATAQLGLVRNLSSNDQFAGPFWGGGRFAAIGVGVDAAASLGFPSDLHGSPTTAIALAGPSFGLGLQAYGDVSASLELVRESAQGTQFLPALQAVWSGSSGD